MSAAGRLAAGAGLVSQATLLGSALNLASLVALVRLLTPEDFAVVALVYLVQETLNAIGPLGLPAALAYFAPQAGPRAGRSLGWYVGKCLFLIAIPYAIGLAWAGPAIALWAGQPALVGPLTWLALALLADLPGQALPGYLVATERFRGAFWVASGFSLSRFASLVVPALLGAGVGVIVALFAVVAGLRGLAFLCYFGLVAEGPLRPPTPRPWGLRSLLAYGLPLSLSAIVGKLNVQLDKYLIATLCAAEVFALYSVGAVELPLVASLAYAVTGALLPRLVQAHAGGDPAAFLGLWHGAMAKVALVMMPLCAATWVLAEPLVRVLFSAEYTAAALPFRVYLLLLPLRLCGYGAVVRALGQTRPVLVAALVGLVTNAALNYPLYLAFGVAGPALASVIAQLVTIVGLLGVIRRRLGVSWRAVFPFPPVLRALGLALVAAAPLALGAPALLAATGERRVDDALALGLGGLGYLCAYLVVGRLAGVVSAADLRYLGAYLSGRLGRRLGA